MDNYIVVVLSEACLILYVCIVMMLYVSPSTAISYRVPKEYVYNVTLFMQ